MTEPQQALAPNILIVDDTPANVLLLVRMLAVRGYNPRPVVSGKLALEAARANPPDLILLDVAMPEMNGYEVCAQLKTDAALKDIPVIFISALSETIDKVKAFHAGGVDYITKPFQFEEVYARVQTHLQVHRLEKLRDDLTHMIVHDLRNPLTSIFGFLELLQISEEKNLSSDSREMVTNACRGVKNMITMISSILDVNKMDSGEMKLQLESCEIDALIRAVIAENQPLSDGRTVTLVAANALPSVRVDAGLIQRVVQNLLSNALKYTPKRGTVRIAVTSSASEIRVTVTDVGPGIVPEYHQKIFEKFGQVEDRNNRVGSGLGLAFCKLAVEIHGGRIGVDSEVGKGSTFWLTLPCSRSEAGVGQSEEQHPPDRV